MISLSYDDGPGPRLTGRIASLLGLFEVRATFFLLGRNAETYPELVDMLAGAGHELACHSYAHLNAWKVSPWRAARDIDDGYRSLSRWVKPNALFRPPYGKYTPFTLLQVRRRGARMVRWTHDSGDTWERGTPPVEQVVSNVERDGGGIVLMHDFDRDTTDAQQRASYVLDLTRALLELARAKRWRVCTVSEYLAASNR